MACDSGRSVHGMRTIASWAGCCEYIAPFEVPAARRPCHCQLGRMLRINFSNWGASSACAATSGCAPHQLLLSSPAPDSCKAWNGVRVGALGSSESKQAFRTLASFTHQPHKKGVVMLSR